MYEGLLLNKTEAIKGGIDYGSSDDRRGKSSNKSIKMGRRSRTIAESGQKKKGRN